MRAADWAVRLWRFAQRWTVDAALFAWLLTFGLLTRSGRDYLSSTYHHFVSYWRDPIPSATLEQLFPDAPRGTVTLAEVPSRGGNVSVEELVQLSRVVAAARPTALFEIGTFDGRTTLNLALNAPADAVVYTLDLPAPAAPTVLPTEAVENYWPGVQRGQRFLGRPEARRITQLAGDSATFDFGPYLGKMDLVFVDGSHAYEYVRNDTEAALRLLRPTGGVVVWHDYTTYWPGVRRYLRELRAARPELALRHLGGTTLCVARVPGR